MNIVIDTSALVAVLLNEPERARILEATTGHAIIGPGSIPWEIGNAFSAMLKRGRLALNEGRRGLDIFLSIPLRYVEVDMSSALSIVQKTNLCAYDAFFIDCAARHNAPLLTLDKTLGRAAREMGLSLVEV